MENTIKMVDISSYQNGINFDALQQMGYNDIIIKATEDTCYTNYCLDVQTRSAQARGMNYGFYHFFRNNGIAEADYFVNTIRPYLSDMDIKPVIDIEAAFDGYQVEAFINRVESLLGVQVMVYCNLPYAKQLAYIPMVLERPIWLAYYGPNDGNIYACDPSYLGYKVFAGQQYSDQNMIGGCYVDTNRMNSAMYIGEVPVIKEPTVVPEASPVVTPDVTGVYTVQSGDTLSGIAAMYGTSAESLAILNGISNPNLIYVGQQIKVTGSASPAPTQPVSSTTTYTVQPGDTLSEIAARYGMSVSEIASLNSISDANFSYVGQVLKLSGSSAPVQSAPSSSVYTVQYGDTLSGIAAAYGTTTSALASLNGISDPNTIYVGQQLTISGGNAPAQSSSEYYVIQYGDTLSGIAAAYGTTTAALASLNGISDPNSIYAGQQIRVR